MEYLEQGAPVDPETYNYIRAGKMQRAMGIPSYKGRMGIRYVDRLKDLKLRKFLTGVAAAIRAKSAME